MKITFLLLTITALQISASVYSQDSRFSLNIKGETMQEALSVIESNSQYKFLYRNELIDVNKQVDLKVKDADIESVLAELFVSEGIIYRIFDDNLIVLTKSKNSSQELSVKGKVVDLQGNPLPGVNIVEKGTTNGVVTNLDGDYYIEVSSPQAVLSFSFVGFLTEDIEIGGRNTINITLVEDIKSLEEVVVIGYGTQSRKKITGAIAKVSSDDIKNAAATGVDKAIQGKAAGVMVTSNTGEPGGGVTIRIRGTTSIGSGNDPLYVIDGVPLENTQTSNRNVGENRVNGMSQINPADIESIEILKDAAATSIYGARAANGVVLITTKRGEKGKGEVSFDYYSGISNVTTRYDVLGASDYAKLVNEGRAQLAADEPEYSPFFTDEFINNPTTDVNWQDEIFRMGSVNEANLSLRGGTEATKYMVSAGFNNQKGIIIGSDYKRYSMRANIDQNLGKRITLV